ncbi:zinc finger BED domain-containing protein RICESLEEPER 2-like protein [Tanacetum coccineum]
MAPRGKRALAQNNEKEDGHSALIKAIIIDELPFSVVDQEGFKEYMEARYYCGFQIPSHEMIVRDCVQELNKKIIGFSPLIRDNGEEIGRAAEKCLLNWGIINVLTISTGSASSSDAAIDYLRTRLVNKVLDGKFLHLKCIIDFIDDLVKDGLNLYPESVARVREAVRYVKEMNIFKHDYTDEGEKMWKHKMRMVLNSHYDVFDDYKGKIRGPQGNAEDAQSRIFMEKYLAEEQGACTSRLMKGKPLLGRNVKGLIELDKYLNEESLQHADGLDLLKWWKNFSGQFPILSKISKVVLALPITAVRLETCYCTDSNVLNDFRSSLLHSMVEALDWILESTKESQSE